MLINQLRFSTAEYIMGWYNKTVILILNFVLIASLLVKETRGDVIEGRDYWRSVAHSELETALNYQWNTNTAKNVIIFLGDGMSFETIAASRIHSAGEKGYLAWERFPNVGLLKTYDSDKQVPDSASTATAVFCGVKTNNGVSGVDANVQRGDCEASLKNENHVDSILSWAQGVGKDTGFVTTTRVTHATPSALYAHTADRSWECEQKMPESASNCKDIARQLIEDEPGKNFKVIMGGGRQMLQSNATGRAGDPLDTWACYSQDGRDLIKYWINDKKGRNLSHKVVQNNDQLSQVNPEETDFLLGIFANGHMSMDWERDTGPEGQPSLEEMTTTAVKILQKSEKGFVLMVEGGLIDYAHHRGHAAQALRETVRFSEAINATLGLIDTKETLVIVTADHSHSLTFQGVSEIGTNILGIATNSSYDNTPYTVLGYSTGGPNNMAYEIHNGTAVRKDPTSEDTTAFTYSQQAVVITDEAKHGGADVPVYAIGPYAHLFQTTHEQNFVAWAAIHAANATQANSNHGSSLMACFLTVFATVLPCL